MYNFLENEGAKNADSDCSFLNNFIESTSAEVQDLQDIILFSDSAGGKNKNKEIVKYCTWLSMKKNVNITHIFPPWGHSYCQCDRNFELYGSILKKKRNSFEP